LRITAGSMDKRCGVCSTCWSNDDPGSLGCPRLACRWADRHEALCAAHKYAESLSARGIFSLFFNTLTRGAPLSR
jgi:hypothetical protein